MRQALAKSAVLVELKGRRVKLQEYRRPSGSCISKFGNSLDKDLVQYKQLLEAPPQGFSGIADRAVNNLALQ